MSYSLQVIYQQEISEAPLNGFYDHDNFIHCESIENDGPCTTLLLELDGRESKKFYVRG